MKSRFTLLVVTVILLMAFSYASAEKEVTFNGRIFAHWFMDLSDTLSYSDFSPGDFDSYNAFGISRAYLGGTAKLSDKTSGKMTIDIAESMTGSYYYRMKYAYLKWKFYNGAQYSLGVKFGLHETPWNMEMEKIWMRRYIAKVPADHWGMETTSDLGASLIGHLGEAGKWGWASLSLYNGADYTHPFDNNPSKDFNLVAFITPLNSNPDFAKSTIGAQFYTGTLNAYNDSAQVKDDYKKTLLSFEVNVAYRELVAVGFEYDSYTSPQRLTQGGIWADTSDNKETALTIFGTLWLKELARDSKLVKDLDLFFRYQMYDPDADDHDIGGGNNYETKFSEMIFGVECAPVDGFASALNYRSQKTTNLPGGADDISTSYLFLNMLFEF